MGALDELQENVARYDEKIDEKAIEDAIGEVMAANPVEPPAPVAVAEAGPNIATLLASMAEVEAAANLPNAGNPPAPGANTTEVLTCLVNQSVRQVDRVAIFIKIGRASWRERV